MTNKRIKFHRDHQKGFLNQARHKINLSFLQIGLDALIGH